MKCPVCNTKMENNVCPLCGMKVKPEGTSATIKYDPMLKRTGNYKQNNSKDILNDYKNIQKPIANMRYKTNSSAGTKRKQSTSNSAFKRIATVIIVIGVISFVTNSAIRIKVFDSFDGLIDDFYTVIEEDTEDYDEDNEYGTYNEELGIYISDDGKSFYRNDELYKVEEGEYYFLDADDVYFDSNFNVLDEVPDNFITIYD